MKDFTEKMQGCSGLGLPEFVEALEVERKKIQVFQKELPLSLELVTQAIERCNQQLSGTTVEYLQGHSECSEQTSSEQHVFEEFIPMKRTSSPDNDEEDGEEHSNKPKEEENFVDKKKSDWLRSVQLWNPNPDPPVKEEMPRKPTVDLKKNGGAFQPFKREKIVGKTNGSVVKAPVSAPATSSSVGTVSEGNDGSVKKEEKESQSQRKQRRNWSQELHRRFLNALQQLGGSHAATPKQIRELMKVDGLTNDEVKSHLQKYRLHTRRPSSAIHNNSNTAQTPQFVVVGGLWVPPPDYAAISSTKTTTTAPVKSSNVGPATEIYSPVAVPRHVTTQGVGQMIHRQQQKQSEYSHSDERVSHSERGVHSNSPDTSCSTHMTSTSGF